MKCCPNQRSIWFLQNQREVDQETYNIKSEGAIQEI